MQQSRLGELLMRNSEERLQDEEKTFTCATGYRSVAV
jgi:hypothetical protein